MPALRIFILRKDMYKKWSLRDLKAVPQNGYKVFSLFSCGGGSTMGYKLAGYDVIGNCEIDGQICSIYRKNHNPTYSFNMDIREFLQLGDGCIPKELFGLDVLDGSPPCSVFSMSGNREKDWGKSKVFREGQSEQTLDDLFFEYVRAVGRLKPKVFIAENVKGLLYGNAKGYVAEILKRFRAIGYKVQLFSLNAALMGVPQRRERVFFIGCRSDMGFPKLRLDFNEPPIPFGDVKSKEGKVATMNCRDLLKQKIPTDRKLSDINKRLYGKESGFNTALVWDDIVAPTITANGEFLRANDDSSFSDEDYIACQSFPYDYDFCGADVKYICGMSVPPYMMKGIAEAVAAQWLSKQGCNR